MALESISHLFLNSFTEPHLKMSNTKHILSKSQPQHQVFELLLYILLGVSLAPNSAFFF